MVKISDAELEVMKIIWKSEEISSTKIIENLKETKWTPNTIRTLIKRLYEKGAIKITKKEKKTYTYKAVIDEKTYKNEATKNLIKQLYNTSINEFLMYYCTSEKLTAKELQDIREMIKKIEE